MHICFRFQSSGASRVIWYGGEVQESPSTWFWRGERRSWRRKREGRTEWRFWWGWIWRWLWRGRRKERWQRGQTRWWFLLKSDFTFWGNSDNLPMVPFGDSRTFFFPDNFFPPDFSTWLSSEPFLLSLSYRKENNLDWNFRGQFFSAKTHFVLTFGQTNSASLTNRSFPYGFLIFFYCYYFLS